MTERIIIILSISAFLFFPDENLDPLYLILFSITGILLFKRLILLKNSISLKLNYLSLAFLTFPIFMLITTIFSSYKYPSMLRMGEILMIFSAFFVFLTMEEKEKNFALNFLIYLSVLLSLFSIFKYFIFDQSRASANFLNPNHMAFVLLAVFFIILTRFLEERKKIFLLLEIPIFISIVLTHSRSSLLALVLFLPFAFLKRVNFRYVLISGSILIILLIAFIFIPNPLSSYILRTHDPFSFRRIQIWGIGIKMFKDNWLFGVGPGNFYYRVEPYRFPEQERYARYAITVGDAHNDFIHLLAEMGIFSLPFISGVILLSIRVLRIALLKDWKTKGLSIAILTIFFNSMFTNSIFHPPLSFLLILLFSMSSHLSFGNLCFSINLRLKRLHKVLLMILFLFLLISCGIVPLISNYLLRKGMITSKTDDIERGLKLVQFAARISPLNSSVKNELGKIYMDLFIKTNEPFYLWKSSSNFTESLRLNPFNNESHTELAKLFSILLIRKGFKEAFEIAEFHWKKAISQAPLNPFYYYNLSQLHLLVNKHGEAEQALKKAVELEPNFIMAHYTLFKVYEITGDSEKKEREERITKDLIKEFANMRHPSRYITKLFSVPEGVMKEIMEK